jgi:hypothetical protein
MRIGRPVSNEHGYTTEFHEIPDPLVDDLGEYLGRNLKDEVIPDIVVARLLITYRHGHNDEFQRLQLIPRGTSFKIMVDVAAHHVLQQMGYKYNCCVYSRQ